MSKNKNGTEKRTIRRSTMSNEDFIVLWQSSLNKDAVGKGYDLGLAAASQRASILRKKKVDLKKFGRGVQVFDIEALNKLAKKSAVK